MALDPISVFAGKSEGPKDPMLAASGMTYRIQRRTKDKVSLLGYGMMRLPQKNRRIDQELVNQQVKYALEHGVNYFDTSPHYQGNKSEGALGTALKASGFPRKSFYVATKLSNFGQPEWSQEESMKMYKKSFEELQVDYIDYYLLHGIGGGGMDQFKKRFIDNGMLDFLLKERKKGKIRNLGFSYHGDVAVFDYLLEHHKKYKWDFAQIEMNYVDWKHAHELNSRNTNAEYLYNECEKRGIQTVMMEPLLGGRLAKLPEVYNKMLKERRPDDSIASWAFRFCGTMPNVLTALSGMTYMEHLVDNVKTFSPLDPLSTEELALLDEVAANLVKYPTIPCTQCKYCMPCPYGVDIPGIFVHYNKCKNEGTLPRLKMSDEYIKLRRNYLIGLDRAVPRMRQADHCIGCGHCVPHCPQNIRIPEELQRISEFVEKLKQNSALHEANPKTD